MSTDTDAKLTDPDITSGEDEGLDLSLRPQVLAEFAGQKSLKESLRIFLQAAQKREEPIEHFLIYGPPGLGKTTLAHIIAHEMGVNIKTTSGPAIERPGDLVSILTNLEPRDVLFIDEIHRLSKVVEETLYPAMEDFSLDIVLGRGPSARTIKIELSPTTIIGATTRIGLLSSPLRDRFGLVHRLDFYSEEELVMVTKRSAKVLGVTIASKAAGQIARRSRGTPRVANRLLKRVRDFAQVERRGTIDEEAVTQALELLGVDRIGLDATDRLLLGTLIDKFEGGPVGLGTLAAAIAEDPGTVEEVIEPFLLQAGLIKRTPRGRVATKLAFEHLGIDFDDSKQEKLL
jgi:Holliday junction DNA helicase RuvB